MAMTLKKETATPPAPQNRARRRLFFKQHPNHPRAKAALKRIDMETNGFEPWWSRRVVVIKRGGRVVKEIPVAELKRTPLENKTAAKGVMSKLSKFLPQKKGS